MFQKHKNAIHRSASDSYYLYSLLVLRFKTKIMQHFIILHRYLVMMSHRFCQWNSQKVTSDHSSASDWLIISVIPIALALCDFHNMFVGMTHFSTLHLVLFTYILKVRRSLYKSFNLYFGRAYPIQTLFHRPCASRHDEVHRIWVAENVNKMWL